MIVSIEAVNLALTDKLERLLPELIGGAPDKTGREWLAEHRAKGGPGDSLMVRLRGDKRGRWVWHARKIGGDPLGLICELRCNGDMRAAFKWARDWLGDELPADAEAARKRRQVMAARVAREERHRRQSMIGFARDIWHASMPLPQTPADFYLRARAIDLRVLTRWPPVLRFHPALLHPELDRELPALVAAVQNNAGEIVAIHRTWLVERASGWDRVRENEGPRVHGKMSLGPVQGHSIHLWNGECADPETGEIKAGWHWSGLRGMPLVHCTEGIENGLALAVVDPRHCYVATLSIGNFAELVLPVNCKRVVWFADNDGANPHTLDALAKGFRAHMAAGRQLAMRRPPAGRKDWNEVLQLGLPAGLRFVQH